MGPTPIFLPPRWFGAHHPFQMKLVVVALFLLATTCAWAGLDDYAGYVVADKGRTYGQGIRVTYLGVNGYQFETAGHALLVDPYFTRVSLPVVALNERVEPDPERVAAGLKHVRPRVDAVLVTHAHFDHLLDVPPIMRQTGARLVAGPTAVNQVHALGIPRSQCREVKAGDVRRIGPWTIRVLAAEHDRVFGSVPMPGTRADIVTPPERPKEWVLGEPLSFIIEAAGRRIYIESGGMPDLLPPETKVDLAILGVALPDSRLHFAPSVRRLHPRYTLPSHQDDFFQPFDRGFIFGKLTRFPEVIRIWEREALPGQLILLDYFRPWTLR